MTMTQCTGCGRKVPSYEGVFHSDGRGGSLGFVCGRCWAQVLSDATGEEIGHLELDPIVLPDAAGHMHTFHFRFNPAPRGIEAFEVSRGVPCGYHFQVMQKGDDPAIVAPLLEKMRRGLSQQHLEPCDVTPGGLQVKDRLLRGRIDCNTDHLDRAPPVVVDGKTLSWEQLGAMLASFEGWQFRLELLDRSEEP
ncbi:MAG: hypothetical protein HY812_12965 [Planctomycetes bacterium]|nr:hypothetical protein [Planctomycetota bacterium]